MSIGKTIKSLRGWMPQAELARRVGVARATVNGWERGTCNPTADKIPAIAKALGVAIDALYESAADTHVNQPSDWSRDLPAPAAERAPQPSFRYGGPGTCEWCKMPKERCDCKERCKILTPEDERARDTNTDGKLMRHLRGEVWPS